MVKKYFFILLFIFPFIQLKAQYSFNSNFKSPFYKLPLERQNADFKIRTRSQGLLVGLQHGKYTFLELGVQATWKKIRLLKPRTWGASATLEYNYPNNVLGYKAAVWTKKGRLNLTYGLTLSYFTNFWESRYGVGPAVGFRLLIFHLITGYNFTVGNKDFTAFNPLYITLRVYLTNSTKIRIRKSHR